MNRSNQNIDIALGLDLAQLKSHGDDLDATFTSLFLRSCPSETFQGGSGLCKSVLDFKYLMSRPNQVH